jgi:hypothetical protein
MVRSCIGLSISLAHGGELPHPTIGQAGLDKSTVYAWLIMNLIMNLIMKKSHQNCMTLPPGLRFIAR